MGSEERKGDSGQGSSSSNNGSGRGGSSHGSASGGSGNGNGIGRRGSWDGCRTDDDSGNRSKEGEKDGRHMHSFQAGSNGEPTAESLQIKEGSSSEHCSTRVKRGISGTVTGDQHMRSKNDCSHEMMGRTRSSFARCTPNGLQGDDVSDCRECSHNQPIGHEGRMYQASVVPGKPMSNEQVCQIIPDLAHVTVGRQLCEDNLPSEEVSQRSPTWKSRKPTGELEKSFAKERVVGDRERTSHSAQKWVPVDHKNGGLPNGGLQSRLSGNISTGIPSGTRENQLEDANAKGMSMSISDGDFMRDETLRSSPSAKHLRRLLTFPSEHAMSSVHSLRSVESLEPRKFTTVAIEQPAHVEVANLRGLLPKEKTFNNPSTNKASLSLVNQSYDSKNSEFVKSQICGKVDDNLRTRDNEDSRVRLTSVRQRMSPAEEEMRRTASAVLDAVDMSCRERLAAEGVVREVGRPMAEFEKVLGAVAPSLPVSHTFPPRLLSDMGTPCISGSATKSREHSCPSCSCKADDFSVCRSEVSDVPLNWLWKWYEEPSYYGVEVRAVDVQRVHRNGGLEEPFLAYFVPYLSGLQLFGYSSKGGPQSLGGYVCPKGKFDHPQLKVFSGHDMLATLFPSPGKVEESSPPKRQAGAPADLVGEDCRNLGIQLLYEFFEADSPQVRQPLFPKVKELVEGVTSQNFHSCGDPAVLDGLLFGDVHPASWFAVAWYPIYRISEGPLRAVFLTYHSFNDFVPRSSLLKLMGGAADIDDSISLPVVGLECYNIQAEPWLSMGGHFVREASIVHERLPANLSKCLENRLSSLKEVAALMARGISNKKGSGSADGSCGSENFKHSDYEFFLKRRW